MTNTTYTTNSYFNLANLLSNILGSSSDGSVSNSPADVRNFKCLSENSDMSVDTENSDSNEAVRKKKIAVSKSTPDFKVRMMNF